MNNSVLIFNLSGGLTDMKKNLLSIKIFCENNNYNFTIKNCSAKPQDNNLNKFIPESVKNNDYMYDVKELFDEKTFLIYKNYISYDDVKDKITDINTFNFFSIYNVGSIFSDKNTKNYLIKNHKKIIYDSTKDFEFIYMGNHFHFIGDICISKYLYDVEFHNSVIPNKKIIDSVNSFKNEIKTNYNFIHYRYESDMMIHVNKISKFKHILLDDIFNLNFFEKKDLPLYIATTNIEELYKNKHVLKNIEDYNNIFYNKNKFIYFNENAFFDFMIGLNSDKILGFSKSGFSITMNRLKNTNNYYDKIL
jgi:hypothetical protein